MDRASQRVLQVLGAGRGAAAATDPVAGPRAELVAELTACRELVWECCTTAYTRSPASDREVPAADDLAAAHRALSRVATAVAQAAQALVMAGDLESPDALVPARRALAAATARAHEARRALGGG